MAQKTDGAALRSILSVLLLCLPACVLSVHRALRFAGLAGGMDGSSWFLPFLLVFPLGIVLSPLAWILLFRTWKRGEVGSVGLAALALPLAATLYLYWSLAAFLARAWLNAARG